MTKFISLFLLLALPYSISQNNWREFVSLSGDFKVECPGSMKEIITRTETAIGELEYHSFAFRDEADDTDNFMYTIMYCDYPQGSLHSDDAELVKDFLEVSVEESVQSINSKLIYATDVNVGTYAGKLWRVDYNDGEGVIRTKAFVKDNRFYSIQTVCSRERSLNKASDRFMDSFRFLSEKEKLHLSQETRPSNSATIALPPKGNNKTKREKKAKKNRPGSEE